MPITYLEDMRLASALINNQSTNTCHKKHQTAKAQKLAQATTDKAAITKTVIVTEIATRTATAQVVVQTAKEAIKSKVVEIAKAVAIDSVKLSQFH